MSLLSGFELWCHLTGTQWTSTSYDDPHFKQQYSESTNSFKALQCRAVVSEHTSHKVKVRKTK